ncbi:CIR protein [Plasmodium chabaudi chabaudi]|uniref:CIR protein n=1 Tax=Plasmodium chabaudi chabaudi TaxID=31271 RepID=A0A4V0K636_PLACU|nr:CIR protein [Plasmodium chabaudi chabaudi]VTZ67603.1 CIR protein [Plasmodium chabaudi chabaudi]|eukprot:XP_016653368.1 CIR protein [Plasmodium chabaudi chabaudi]
MSYNQACNLFHGLDELFEEGFGDVKELDSLSILFNDYCPERGESKRCDTDYERISAVAGYLFMNFIADNNIDINNDNNYYIQYFVMWISNKLHEIATNNYKYLNQPYENNLDKSIGNFDFLNSRDDTKELKDANITIMNILYLLFKEICKTVWMDQGKNTKIYEHTTQITQCFLIYTELSKFVNPCSPYLELLDHLKTLYDDYREDAIQNKIHGRYTPELLRRFPEIDNTTKKFNLKSPECKKVHEQLIKNAQKLIKEEKEKEEGKGKTPKKEKRNGYEEEEEDEEDDEEQDDDALSSLLKLLTSGDDNNKEPGNVKSQDRKLEKRDESKDSRSELQIPEKSNKSATVTQGKSSKNITHNTNAQPGKKSTPATPGKPPPGKPPPGKPATTKPEATKPAAPPKSQLKPETRQKTQQQPTTGRSPSTTSSTITTSPTDTQTSSSTTASSGTKSESLKLSRSAESSNPQKETKTPTTQPEAQQKIAANVASPQTPPVKPAPAQPAPAQPVPAQTAAAKPALAKPASTQTATAKPVPPQTAAAKPVPPQTAAAKPVPPQTAAAKPAAAKPQPQQGSTNLKSTELAGSLKAQQTQQSSGTLSSTEYEASKTPKTNTTTQQHAKPEPKISVSEKPARSSPHPEKETKTTQKAPPAKPAPAQPTDSKPVPVQTANVKPAPAKSQKDVPSAVSGSSKTISEGIKVSLNTPTSTTTNQTPVQPKSKILSSAASTTASTHTTSHIVKTPSISTTFLTRTKSPSEQSEFTESSLLETLKQAEPSPQQVQSSKKTSKDLSPTSAGTNAISLAGKKESPSIKTSTTTSSITETVSTGATTVAAMSSIKSTLPIQDDDSKQKYRGKRSTDSRDLTIILSTGSRDTGGQLSRQDITQENSGSSSSLSHQSQGTNGKIKNQTSKSKDQEIQSKNESDKSSGPQNGVGSTQGNAETVSKTNSSSDIPNQLQSPIPKHGDIGGGLGSLGGKSTNNTLKKTDNVDKSLPGSKASSQTMESRGQGNEAITAPGIQNSGNGVPNDIYNGAGGIKYNAGTEKSGWGISNGVTVNNEANENKKLVQHQGAVNKHGSSSSGSVDTNGGTGGSRTNKGSSGIGSNSSGSGIDTSSSPLSQPQSQSPSSLPSPVTSSSTPSITLSFSAPETNTSSSITTTVPTAENSESDMSSIETTLPERNDASQKLSRGKRSAAPVSLTTTPTAEPGVTSDTSPSSTQLITSQTNPTPTQDALQRTNITDIKVDEKTSIWCISSNKKCNIIGIGIIGISIFVFLAFMFKYLPFGSRKKSKKKKITKKVINLVDGRKMEKTFIKSIDREKKSNIIINSGDNKKIAKIIMNSDDTNKPIKMAINSWDEKQKTYITINSDDNIKPIKKAINPWDEKRMTHITINSDDNIKPIKKAINPWDEKRMTHITINSEHTKKHTKSVINSSDRKKTKIIANSVNEKISLLNIYKFMKADPMPFINLFFLLIFFVYKRKRSTIE